MRVLEPAGPVAQGATGISVAPTSGPVDTHLHNPEAEAEAEADSEAEAESKAES